MGTRMVVGVSGWGFWRRVLLAIVCFISIGPIAFARAQAGDAPSVFDVATIKPWGGKTGMMWDCSQRRLHATAVPVAWMIEQAFDLYSFQVSGGPSWMRDALFDVEAAVTDAAANRLPNAADGGGGDRACNRAGVQALLKERFQLHFIWKQVEQPTYVLVMDKPGRLPRRSEANVMAGSMGAGAVKLTGVSMNELSKVFSSNVGRAVLNKTQLAGRFDVALNWSPELDPSSGPDTTRDETLPSLLTAVKEQLGLRLEAQKAPGRVLVVEGVERPSGEQ